MKDYRIIAIVGMPGSGKGTITDALEKDGYPIVHFGNMVAEEIEKRGLDFVKNEVFVRHDMRKTDGPAVMAVRAATKADSLIKKGKSTIIFDGLYSWTEYKYLEDKYGDSLTVVAVVAPKIIRRKRAIARRDGKRIYTINKLIKREIDEIENMEKGGPIAYADYYIHNDDSLDDFKSKLDSLRKKLKI